MAKIVELIFTYEIYSDSRVYELWTKGGELVAHKTFHRSEDRQPASFVNNSIVGFSEDD